MTPQDVRAHASAMPFNSPAYPLGPYRYENRELLSICYRSDHALLSAVVPEPLLPASEEVMCNFTRIDDSTGFGSYHIAAQVIPVLLPGGAAANYTRFMFVDAHPPSAGGRELWGFPQKLGAPSLKVERDTLVGRLDLGRLNIATASMGFKHQPLAGEDALAALSTPGVLLKIMPHVDGTAAVCELVRYSFTSIKLEGAWRGPAALSLHPHALAPLATLPVREVLWGAHIVADMTLEMGSVIHDYLA